MEFESLEDLYEYVEKAHEKIVSNDVQNVIKNAESEVIKEEVYKKYNPAEYKRREDNGGLSDIKNMKTLPPVKYGNTIEVEVVNNTPINPHQDGINRHYQLDEVIEYGGRYYEYPLKNRDEDKYTYLKPRPFTEMTKVRLLATKEHEKAYKSAMKSMGIDID